MSADWRNYTGSKPVSASERIAAELRSPVRSYLAGDHRSLSIGRVTDGPSRQAIAAPADRTGEDLFFTDSADARGAVLCPVTARVGAARGKGPLPDRAGVDVDKLTFRVVTHTTGAE